MKQPLRPQYQQLDPRHSTICVGGAGLHIEEERIHEEDVRAHDECYLTDPVWSPDGKELAVVATREETLTSDLIVITLRTVAEREVASENASSGLFAPSWQSL